MRTDVGIIDVMVQCQFGKERIEFPFARELLRDEESRRAWPSLGIVSHMFGDAADREREAGDPDRVVAVFDQAGIERGQLPVYPGMADEQLDQIERYAPRFFGTLRVDPHEGYAAVAQMDRIIRRRPWIRSVSIMPALLYPPIPPNSKEFYPVYAKCIELGVPIMMNVGAPGPRVPSATQHPSLYEEVAWFYPELTLVLKHGGYPWVAECVALLRKWPNLYYATTAYAPKRYPAEIVEYMQTARDHHVIYGGYYPSLGFDRIVSELQAIDLPDEPAAKFLRGNAVKVFGL
jgi:predicted TIM-barrel fold metal-dependent hydrolase